MFAKKSGLLLALAFLCAVGPTQSADQLIGPEFQVNSYTTNWQNLPAVASDADGNFMIVWSSYTQDGSDNGIFAQRYNSAGAAQGGEFQINTYTTSGQHTPVISADGNGNFVVVWASIGPDGAGAGIVGQRYDSSGSALGGEFQVNSYTTGEQRYPSVATDSSDGFVVVWSSDGQDGSGYGIFGQRLDSLGGSLGTEFQVNSYTPGQQHLASVATDGSDGFVVVWPSSDQDGSGYGVFGQRFDAARAPVGAEFQVNEFTTSEQWFASVSAAPEGDFVVVWHSYLQDGSDYGIFGRRFDSLGGTLGTEFQVNSFTTGGQYYPKVSTNTAGRFVVVWQSYNQDGSSYGTFAQFFGSDGNAQNQEFQVNSYTTDEQSRASVSAGPKETFVATWRSRGQDGDMMGVFGQRLDLSQIFSDGFESGDTTAW